MRRITTEDVKRWHLPAFDYLPAEILDQLPALYSTEDQPDPLAVVKYFAPDAQYTWYATEYDPEERVFFGLVQGHFEELGYFSLAELEDARGPWGLPVERDLGFEPTPLSKLRRRPG